MNNNKFILDYINNFYDAPDLDTKIHPTQGDIYILKVPIEILKIHGRKPEEIVHDSSKIVKEEETDEPSLDGIILGFVIVSNECDIVQNKLEYCSYLPIYSLKVEMKKYEKNEKGRKDAWSLWSAIIHQRDPRTLYFPPHSSVGDDFGGYVETQQVKSLTLKDFRNQFGSPVLVLKSPYKEFFSNRTAYLFNRIPLKNQNKNQVNDWFKEMFLEL